MSDTVPNPFPPYHPDQDLRERGIVGKYHVARLYPSTKHVGCRYFVLDLSHDPFAGPAAIAYARACRTEYPALSKDLRVLAGKTADEGDEQAATPGRSIGDVVAALDTIRAAIRRSDDGPQAGLNALSIIEDELDQREFAIDRAYDESQAADTTIGRLESARDAAFAKGARETELTALKGARGHLKDVARGIATPEQALKEIDEKIAALKAEATEAEDADVEEEA